MGGRTQPIKVTCVGIKAEELVCIIRRLVAHRGDGKRTDQIGHKASQVSRCQRRNIQIWKGGRLGTRLELEISP